MYTPEERLDIYMYLLPIFELKHPFREGGKAGFCNAFVWIPTPFVLSYDLKYLPELDEQNPHSGFSHWFETVHAQFRDDKRCEVLYNAIDKVLKIIHEQKRR